MRRPKVGTRKGGNGTTIVEVSHPDTGSGCLISVNLTSNGTVRVDVHRADPWTVITMPDDVERHPVGTGESCYYTVPVRT